MPVKIVAQIMYIFFSCSPDFKLFPSRLVLNSILSFSRLQVLTVCLKQIRSVNKEKCIQSKSNLKKCFNYYFLFTILKFNHRNFLITIKFQV